MEDLTGGCHCGNIRIDVALSGQAATMTPRACDCDFCHKHGAAYISDPDGRLAVAVEDETLLRRYRQGSQTAEMLVCGNCGILVGAVFRAGDEIFGTVNVRALAPQAAFGDSQTASPKLLETDEKIDRWKALWFRCVTFATSAPQPDDSGALRADPAPTKQGGA